MKKVLLSLVLIPLFLTSCLYDEVAEMKENKIEGVWTFEKARFREKWELFGDDMMHHFKGDIIEFYDDNTALYDDFQLRQQFTGNWGVTYEIEYDEEGDEVPVYFLDMGFYDPIEDQVFGYYAELHFLTRKRMRISAWNDRGEYIFKLKKI